MEEDCDFDTEGIFETPGGGTSQIGGGTASGHQHEAVVSLLLPVKYKRILTNFQSFKQVARKSIC